RPRQALTRISRYSVRTRRGPAGSSGFLSHLPEGKGNAESAVSLTNQIREVGDEAAGSGIPLQSHRGTPTGTRISESEPTAHSPRETARPRFSCSNRGATRDLRISHDVRGPFLRILSQYSPRIIHKLAVPPTVLGPGRWV